MIVQCFVATAVVVTKWAESGIYLHEIGTPVYSNILFGVYLAHGGLGYQVMKTNVLVLPMPTIALVNNPSTFLLYDSNEVSGLDSRAARITRHSLWGVAGETFGHHLPDPVSLWAHVVIYQLLEKTLARHDVSVRIPGFIPADLVQILGMVIQVYGLCLCRGDVLLMIGPEFWALKTILLSPVVVQ